MIKKTHGSLLLLLIFTGLACNKEIEQVPVPPFTVYPNPFVEDFAVHLEQTIPANSEIQLRILDGKNNLIAVWEDPDPGSSIRVNMMGQKKAIYYAELRVGPEVFILPIIKFE